MNWLRASRAIGGLLAIATLLGLVIGDFFITRLTLTPDMIALLLGLISALLGVDIITKRMPLEVSVKTGSKEDNDESP